MADSSMVLLNEEVAGAPEVKAEGVPPNEEVKVDGGLKCAICLLNDHKYKCPRCSLKTCSLECCKKHKSDSNCSGQRDKTKFVDKSGFDEMTLLSDYRFLEEQARLVDAAHREPVVDNSLPQVSGFFDNLRKFVHSSFAIDLQFMPSEATRHKQNKTRFNRNANLVIWSLELVFELGNTVVKIHTKSNLFHSNETLSTLLSRFHRIYSKSLFQADQRSSSTKERQLTESESQSVLLVFDAFKKNFQEVSSSDQLNGHDLHVLIEQVQPGRRTYVKLDLDQRLDQALRGRTVIEYPTLFVVREQDIHKYPVEAVSDRYDTASGQKRGPSPSESEQRSSNAKQPRPASPEPVAEPLKAPVIQRLVSQDYELEEGELD